MHPPESPMRLPGTLWGIAAYFNPAGYRSKLRNYRLFRKASKRQGLQLIVAETAFGDAPYELADDDAEIVLRFRTDAVLWQKERLLNLALAALPSDCDKVVWIDGDVLLENGEWISETASLLERFAVVQPFAEAVQLKPDTVRPDDMDERDKSTAHAWAAHANPSTFVFAGHPGYACAARRSVLDRIGFYDRSIIGGGDTIFLTTCLGIPPAKNPYIGHYGQAIFRDIDPWFRRARSEMRGSLSSVPGRLFHLWHGDRAKRQYHERAFLLEGFDPTIDLKHDREGCLAWATEKNDLHKRVRAYFAARDEDA